VIVVRFVIILVLLAVGASGVLYLITRDRRYLLFIRQIIRYTLWLLAAVMLLWALERFMLVL
jgi:hypothetical protein